MVKKVVKALYAHKSNREELISKVEENMQKELRQFLLLADKEVEYDIIKYDRGNVTLITSPDWDTANEPIVGVCRRWEVGQWSGNYIGTYKEMNNFKQIYHNKWQFVAEDYTGFDIEEAKERTKVWNTIPNLNKSKIGYKSYWEELLKENGISC